MKEVEEKGESHKQEQPHHQIHFTVDREPVEVLSRNREETELTVAEILDASGNTPASDHYLIQYFGEGHKDSTEYKDLAERLRVKNHARFSVVCVKPTPLSHI